MGKNVEGTIVGALMVLLMVGGGITQATMPKFIEAPVTEICFIPIPLPPWQGLVLRLWGTGRINDETFLKNFPISGEDGDKMLEKQGFHPLELENLAHCLIKSFKGKSNGNRTP